MSFIDQVDPELVDALDFFPAELMTAIGDDPPKAREMFQPIWDELADELKDSPVSIEERTIPGPDGDIGLVIYQPPTPAPRGGLLWIHGGGYIVGSGRNDPARRIGFAGTSGCTRIVDYRLAPDPPIRKPSPLLGALCWLAENAASWRRSGSNRHRRRPSRVGVERRISLYNPPHGPSSLISC